MPQTLFEGDLIVGHVYSAKRPAPAGGVFNPLYNDRQILHISLDQVQYDSPTVRFGGKYPRISIEAFRKWAAEDVTDRMPNADDWRSYPTGAAK